MRRVEMRVLALAAVVLAGEVGAQHAPAPLRSLGVGVDFAGSTLSNARGGSFLGPTIGTELGTKGPLTLRVDASLQADPWTVIHRNQAVCSCWRGPTSDDTRHLKTLGTATVAVEAGTRDRVSIGGLFVAARVGGGAGRWGAGEFIYSYSPWAPALAYREEGYTAAVVTGGAEVGVWIPAFGRPHRVAVRVDAIHRRDFSSTRLAVVVLRH